MTEETAAFKLFYNGGKHCLVFLQSPKYVFKVSAQHQSSFYFMCFKKGSKSHQILLRYN